MSSSNLCGCHCCSKSCTTGFSASKCLSGPNSFSQLRGSKTREAGDSFLLFSSLPSDVTKYLSQQVNCSVLLLTRIAFHSSSTTSLTQLFTKKSHKILATCLLTNIIKNFLTSLLFHSMFLSALSSCFVTSS